MQPDGTERVVYRASALGMCDKALVATALGFDPTSKPDWFQEVLDEGTNAEPIIAAMYTDETGDEPTDDQKSVRLYVLDNSEDQEVWIYGSIDGLVWRTGSPVLWESKKFRDSTWGKALKQGVEINKNYPMQVSAMMHALSDEYETDVELDFTIGHMDTETGEIVEIFVHHLIDPPVNRLGIRKRIKHLEELIRVGDMSGTLCPLPLMYPCGFFHFHDEVVGTPLPRVEADVTLEWLVTEYQKADQIRKDLEAAVKKASTVSRDHKDAIAEWLKAEGHEGERVITNIEGKDYELITETKKRASYEVKATEFQQTTIKQSK